MFAQQSMESVAESLRRAGNWCREYLELQNSREFAAAFGDVMRTFEEITSQSADDGSDRFERLKQLERTLDERFAALVDKYQTHVAIRAELPRNPNSPPDEIISLFVYGTLKRGGCREVAMAGQRFLGVAITRPEYRLYHCGDYPALVRDATGTAVEGELWEIDAPCLAKLDEIEGVSMRLYERAEISLSPPYADVKAESYFYLRSVNGLRDCGPRWP